MILNGRKSPVASYINRHLSEVVLAVLLALGTAMMTLSHRPATDKLEQLGRGSYATFQNVLHDIGAFFGGSWNAIAELRRMRLELTRARQRLLQLQLLSSEITELKYHNSQLRRQLQFAEQSLNRPLPAEVIARDPGNLFTTLTINRGLKHGVNSEMAVVALQDGSQGLVGRVVDVDENSALVQPISGRASFVSARLQKLRYDGLIQGMGAKSKTLLMRHVSSAARDQITLGETVITSGLGGIFPSGLQIGQVIELRDEDYQNSLDLIINPQIEVSRLEYVFVIVPEIQ